MQTTNWTPINLRHRQSRDLLVVTVVMLALLASATAFLLYRHWHTQCPLNQRETGQRLQVSKIAPNGDYVSLVRIAAKFANFQNVKYSIMGIRTDTTSLASKLSRPDVLV